MEQSHDNNVKVLNSTSYIKRWTNDQARTQWQLYKAKEQQLPKDKESQT